MKMDNPQERQFFDIGWLVGIIDGEGSFMIFRMKQPNGSICFQPMINISNTNSKIIEKAQNVIKQLGLACHVQYKVKKSVKNKSYWSLNITGLKRTHAFLTKMLSHLECRYPQASTLKRYTDLRLSKPCKSPYGDEEFFLINQLRELNGSSKTESSETIRQTSKDEDIVRTATKVVEVDGNDQSFSASA